MSIPAQRPSQALTMVLNPVRVEFPSTVLVTMTLTAGSTDSEFALVVGTSPEAETGGEVTSEGLRVETSSIAVELDFGISVEVDALSAELTAALT